MRVNCYMKQYSKTAEEKQLAATQTDAASAETMAAQALSGSAFKEYLNTNVENLRIIGKQRGTANRNANKERSSTCPMHRKTLV